MITLDYLPGHPEIQLYQDDEMIRINTDTEVLGNFITVYKKDSVLDMGTNQGALLLYANMFHPSKLTGLELNERACELARKNMELNHVENAEIICGNIITYASDPVDVIICNPPYFKTEENNKARNPYLSVAKHESDLTLKVLLDSIERNLKDNGTLYFLFLSSRMDEVMVGLRRKHLIPKTVQFVYDEEKKYSNVFMIKAIKNGKPGMTIEKPVLINRKSK